MGQRRKYDKEFKENALELLKVSGKSVPKVAEELGIPPKNLYTWIEEAKELGDNAFPGNGNPRDKEIAVLKKEIANLKMERDILKKAMAIFSQPNK